MSKKLDRIRRQLEAYVQLCERCCVCRWPKYRPGRRMELHHIVGRRRGMDAHDHRNLCLLCRDCHEGFHAGGKKNLTLGNILFAKKEEDGEEMLDLSFLAWLLGRVGLKEDPTPLPEWAIEERERNEKFR
jgi:hypothetical protein